MGLFVQIHPSVGSSFRQSFEGLAETIGSLPGMFFEPDGSFVWVDHSRSSSKQMDGMVYDREGRLAYVEVKGDFSKQQWTVLCNAISQLPANTDSPFADWGRLIRVHDVHQSVWCTASEILQHCH